MPQRPNSKTNVYAVITGDIVSSTKLAPVALKKVRETISQTVHAFDVRSTGAIARRAEFFQGDSWQVLLGEPRAALRLTILIAARLLAKENVETRAAIGIGMIDGLEKASAISTGEAFTLSGHALEQIKNYLRITGSLPERIDHPLSLWFPGLLHLCSGLMRGWTRRQAEVMSVWLSLPHPTYEAIAAELSITPQSVGDILTSANLTSLREALRVFRGTDWQNLPGSEHERNS